MIKALPFLLLILLALIWGSSFILMQLGLHHLNAYQIAILRVGFAGLVLFPVGLKHFNKVEKKDLSLFFISGLVGSFIPAFLFPLAQTEISSSLSGTLNSLTPIFTLLLGVLIFKETYKKKQYLGVFIGLIGAIMVILGGNRIGASGNIFYALFAVCAAFLYGINVNIIKYKFAQYNAWAVTSIPFLLMLPVCIILAPLLFYDFQVNPLAEVDFTKSFLAILVLSFVGTTISLLIFNRLIQMTSAVFSSSVTYLIPIVAIFWGVLSGEKVTIFQYAGLLLILGGILLIRTRSKKGRSVRNLFIR